jgi:hypothetical protein
VQPSNAVGGLARDAVELLLLALEDLARRARRSARGALGPGHGRAGLVEDRLARRAGGRTCRVLGAVQQVGDASVVGGVHRAGVRDEVGGKGRIAGRASDGYPRSVARRDWSGRVNLQFIRMHILEYY